MNARAKETQPSREPGVVWKWKMIRQWRNNRTFAMVQILELLVSFAILIALLGIPNPTPTGVVLRILCGALLVWAAWFLFGPYRATRRPGSDGGSAAEEKKLYQETRDSA